MKRRSFLSSIVSILLAPKLLCATPKKLPFGFQKQIDLFRENKTVRGLLYYIEKTTKGNGDIQILKSAIDDQIPEDDKIVYYINNTVWTEDWVMPSNWVILERLDKSCYPSLILTTIEVV